MNQEISLDKIKYTEINVIIKSNNELGNFIENINNAIDLLFKLTVHIHESSDDPQSESGQFEWFCSMNYYQAPYTFTSIISIWEKGYYFESAILIRTLLESLVQMKYFKEHMNKLEGHIKKEKNIRFKDMFDYCAPGLYDYTYFQLSDFAHGGVTKEIVRSKQVTNERFVKVGCDYDEFLATYTINILYVLLLGYLHNFFECFSNSRDVMENDKEFKEVYSNKIAEMFKSIESHKKSNPHSKEWYKIILPLIN